MFGSKHKKRDILEIRTLYESGQKTPKQIKEMYPQFTQKYLYDILYYRCWKHVQTGITTKIKASTALNSEQVKEIRHLYDNQLITQKQIQEKYNIARSTCSQLVNRKSWKHI